jgi:gliding motility-associated-like protein
LGADTCLGEKDSLVLKAVPGYNTYIWNGISTASSKYVVRQPGDYVLQIENECGMQSDTVKILQQCAFDIFMPNAFTPNGDGRNDLFRVPPQNYNRLISFTVFNRWGQKIFETKNISEGWNGMNREYPAAAGTYIYIIVMKSLDDKTTFTKKGWVTLIR